MIWNCPDISFLFFFVFRAGGKKEHLDENNFCHYYGIFFESVALKVSYLTTAMFHFFSRKLRDTLATAFERHFTAEDFTEMDQHRC